MLFALIFGFILVAIATLVAWGFGDPDKPRLPAGGLGTTPSERLRQSKEISFFDGENEYYNDALSKARGVG